ncbi:ParB/RepB/Spo0J family partition protein [Acidithiobacillus sp. IBUN Pt1247-S3]|uniref:ParB/RepB/Spo0J family partition protein n=1 Tax=Acidithiobacillus sp. IBUN Pt1247-S3 TaxID=3166642 RepID=UPI0034E456D5
MAKIDSSRTMLDEIEKAFAELEAQGEVFPGDDPARKSAPPASEPANAALYLSLSDIEADPEQPRKSFVGDSEADNSLESLRDSIMQHGVLQPISVRRVESGKYRIIAGERRWRASCMAHESGAACQRAGYDLSRIPAVILEPVDDADRLEMQLVENLARADMPPMDTARALDRLRSCMDPKPSMEELARRLGRSRAWVHQMLSMVSPEAQEVAGILGVPVESIGRTDLSRMCGWLKDDAKRKVLETIRSRLSPGVMLTRALVDEEEARYEQARQASQRPEPATESGAVDGDGVRLVPDGVVTPDAGAGENVLKEPEEYIVVHSPEDLVGLQMDDGSYDGEDDDEDGGEGEDPLTDEGVDDGVQPPAVAPQALVTVAGAPESARPATGSPVPAAAASGAAPASAAATGVHSLAFPVPQAMLARLFRLAGQPLDGTPTPEQFVEALSVVLAVQEG